MKKMFLCSLAILTLLGCTRSGKERIVTLERLLDEMISFDQAALYPDPFYRCRQISSYDRRSVSPDKPFWFANHDGFGYIRMDTTYARQERVLFEADGPGAVTRIWMTSLRKDGVLRFYFDGEETPRLVVPAYDMKRAPFNAGEALSLTHTHYGEAVEERGGNTFFCPLPYAESCRITFEDTFGEELPHYYQINYRTYEDGTKLRTFSIEDVNRLQDKITEVNATLLNPPTFRDGMKTHIGRQIAPGEYKAVTLPEGENRVRTLDITVKCDTTVYADVMRGLRLRITCDDRQTVCVPLSDFSGGGIGAPGVQSWYLSSDGKGHVISRWVMPYRHRAEVGFENGSVHMAEISADIYTAPTDYWTPQTLYFHAIWKSEEGIPVSNRYESDDNIEWNFTTLSGKGVYRGDVLTLYNHAPDWYGEGDEKIWVDNDTFPSHFGTGTEDYYNCSWAPVIPFNTPFGGAPRADEASSHGYNTFMRTRNLDAIPFREKLRFDIEMLSWNPGTVDYATTVFWYGE